MERWDNLAALTPHLLLWYDTHRRTMPWREEASPYRTWVSEIMLQQTRVSAVIPYFERFVQELPDVASLAAVPEDRLFKLWEGLGYYSRARNLQKAARQMTERYGGRLPRTVAELRTLAGIGDYTAAAIASIHFGAAEPAVDGNLLRVAARISGCTADISSEKTKKMIREQLRSAIDRDAPGKYNQAMMDLGATVCLPNGKPLCGQCPARTLCEAYRTDRTELLPVRAEKKPRRVEERTVFLLRRGNTVALHRRGERGLLARMQEFPNVAGNLDASAAQIVLAQWGLSVQSIKELPPAKHIFTHVEWQMKGYTAEVAGECADFTWMDAAGFEAAAIPGAFRRYTAAVRSQFAEEKEEL